MDRTRGLDALDRQPNGHSHGSIPDVAQLPLDHAVAVVIKLYQDFVSKLQLLTVELATGELELPDVCPALQDAWARYSTGLALLWHKLTPRIGDRELVEIKPGLRQSRAPAGAWRDLEDLIGMLQEPWELLARRTPDGYFIRTSSLDRVARGLDSLPRLLKQVVPADELGLWAELDANKPEANDPTEPRLLTTKQTHEEFAIGISTLNRAKSRGQIRSYRSPNAPANGTNLYRESDLEKLRPRRNRPLGDHRS